MTEMQRTTTSRWWEQTIQRVPDGLRRKIAEIEGEVLEDPTAVHRLFPATARLVGRSPQALREPTGVLPTTLDEVVRIVLLEALAVARARERALLMEDIQVLYRHGDADEKRAVLRALHRLDLGDAALALVSDALRTNDTRLMAAALGPYGRKHLDAASWRQGILKCLFVGVPLDAVDGVNERADRQLATMVAAYAHERLAADRDVPPDAVRLLSAFPDVVEKARLSDLLPPAEPQTHI
jgi:hypothetical protein